LLLHIYKGKEDKEQVNQNDTIKVMIVGAGELGTYLFDTIVDESGMSLSGIVDVNGEFSSVDLAGARNIPIFTSLSEAMRTMPEIIFHLPESGVSTTELLALKPPHAEIIEYQGIRFFLNMIRHSRIQTIRQVRRRTGVVSGSLTAAVDAKPSDTSDQACRALNSAVSHKKKGVRNILCIDQDRDFLESLTAMLTAAGYRITCAQSGKEGLDDAFHATPDLIILDLAVSDIGYFEMFSALRNNPQTADVPIIILTGKDISMGERLSLVGQIEELVHKNYCTNEDLLDHIRNLEKPSPVRVGLLDTQSGLFDRSYFQIRLAQEICRADRHQIVFSILMADIDHFDEFSRINGTQNCDICIKSIADFLRETTRGSDILVRYGSDEFAILLTDTTEEDSFIVARRLLAFIENYQFAGVEQLEHGKLTASIAVVHYDRIAPCIPEKMISQAQQLIREAKKDGGREIKAYGHNDPLEIDAQVNDDVG